jgi:CheY-like chemotaxis protein
VAFSELRSSEKGILLARLKRVLSRVKVVETHANWESGDATPLAGRPDKTTGGRQCPIKPLVVVVEDDTDTSNYMRIVLQRQYKVVTAASASEAREALKRCGSEVRVIIMDLSLKGAEDGLELIRALRKQRDFKRVPIIAATAHVFPEDREHAFAAGSTAFLPKPFLCGELAAAVSKALCGDASAGK